MFDHRCWKQIDNYVNKIDPLTKEKTDPVSVGHKQLDNTKISKRLKFDGLIDDDFVDKVGRIPIDDLIALKLETVGKAIQEPYFGYELFYSFSNIVLAAVAKYFYSISPARHGLWPALKSAYPAFRHADKHFNLQQRLFGAKTKKGYVIDQMYKSRLERIEKERQ